MKSAARPPQTEVGGDGASAGEGVDGAGQAQTSAAAGSETADAAPTVAASATQTQAAQKASARTRKGTPRSRARTPKMSGEAGKKTASRRKASPSARQVAQQTKEKNVKQEEVPPPSPPAVAAKERAEQDAAGKVEPSTPLDSDFRRAFLQKVYRQLQVTHPNQDDATIRNFATRLEMEVCRKVSNRVEYAAVINQELQKMMQFDTSQPSAPPSSSGGYQGPKEPSNQAQPPIAASSDGTPKAEPNQVLITHSRRFEYEQALAKAQAQFGGGGEAGFSAQGMTPTQQQPVKSEEYFTQPMGMNQNPAYALDQGSRGQQQQQQQQQNLSVQDLGGPTMEQFRSVPPASPVISQGFPLAPQLPSNRPEIPSSGVPQNALDVQQQQQQQQQQQHQQQQMGMFQMQHQQQPGFQRPQQRALTLQEFMAQVQHLDKPVLVELLWNQRNALAQWQRRASQFEHQLAAFRNASSAMRGPGVCPPYYSASPATPNAYVPTNVTSEAEMQRAQERQNMRAMQQQQQQAQSRPQPYPYQPPQQQPQQQVQYGDGNAPRPQSSASNVNSGANTLNPSIYWEKIQALKAAHAGDLCVAHRALVRHTAPPNSVHSVKAESVKNNIALVLSILSEPVKPNIQPRSFEVLASIERFIQTTVVPIVRKVQATGMDPQASTTPQMNSDPMMQTPGAAAAVAAKATPASGGLSMYSPGDQQDGMSRNPTASSDNREAQGQWPFPTAFIGNRATQQTSRSTLTEDKPNVSAIRRSGGVMESPTQQAPPESNRPSPSEPSREQVRMNPDGAISGGRMDSLQTGPSMDQGSPFGVVPAVKPPSVSVAPPSEPRAPSLVDVQCSSQENGDPTASTPKLMQPPGVEESLNDFSDFPELDFDDALQDSLTKDGQFVKENNPSNTAKKRGIEDV